MPVPRTPVDRRLGTLTGSLSLAPAITPADVRGDVWLVLYPTGPITPASVAIGATILRDVDLSSPVPYVLRSEVDYDGGGATALVPAPATFQLFAVFDADADGVLHEAGELYAAASAESSAGVPLCLTDERLEFQHDVVFNVVLE